MNAHDLELALALAALLFVIGLAAGARWGRPEGQAMFIFLLVTAAAEVAVGLALILALSGKLKDLDADEIRSGGD